MTNLDQVKNALEGYEGRYWNSYAGDYSYEDVLDVFKIEVQDDMEWYIDSEGNIWISSPDDIYPTTENQSPFFNILDEDVDPQELNL